MKGRPREREKARGGEGWASGGTEKNAGREMFFRQASPGRSVGGASHTRHLCGNKMGKGGERGRGGLPRCVERAPFLSRAPRPRASSSNLPPPQPGLSVNRPDPTIVCGSEPTPFSSNTRKQARFLIFFPPQFLPSLSLFFYTVTLLCEAPNQNLLRPS